MIALGVVKLWRSRQELLSKLSSDFASAGPYTRLLQEDTEGILEMLSMRDGEPLAGGRTAL